MVLITKKILWEWDQTNFSVIHQAMFSIRIPAYHQLSMLCWIIRSAEQLAAGGMTDLKHHHIPIQGVYDLEVYLKVCGPLLSTVMVSPQNKFHNIGIIISLSNTCL